MRRCQIEARLSYSKIMLRATPPIKISVVAATLGYGTVSDFIRFFEKHIQKSASEWGREERERTEQEHRRASTRRTNSNLTED
jgi:AraC-like DNA-binding protein